MYITIFGIMVNAKVGSLFILMYLQYALSQAYNSLSANFVRPVDLTVGF